MLVPGKIAPGSELRITATFSDDAGVLADPATVIFKTMSPAGKETVYTYGSSPELQRQSAGIYLCDFTPDEGGRWYYRWQSTGTGKTLAKESSFIVQYSPFIDGRMPDAYQG